MTDDAAEATFREAVGREGSLKRLGRALVLSDRASFHLLEVVTPRTLRAAVPVLREAMGGKDLTLRRVTLEEMSSRDRLTATVFEALGAEVDAATPLLIDASAALPSEEDAWVWCFDRWNERRDRVATERTAPVVLAVPSWLSARLAESAPDLWSVRGPSARVDIGPPPAIAMIDRVPMAIHLSIKDQGTQEPPSQAVLDFLSDTGPGTSYTTEEVVTAASSLLQWASRWNETSEFSQSATLLRLAVDGLLQAQTADPSHEELRLLCLSSIISLGGLQLERELFDEAIELYSRALLNLGSHSFSTLGLATARSMSVASILQGAQALLVSGRGAAARRLLSSNAKAFSLPLPAFATEETLLTFQIALITRANVVVGDIINSLSIVRLVAQLIDFGREPDARGFCLAVLAEFHLDRGDLDRVLSTGRNVLTDISNKRVIIGVARCVTAAGDPASAELMLRLALLLTEAPHPNTNADAYVLGAEVARALGDDALIQQYVALAQAALDDLQQRDPTSPRCQRLLARFAAQLVAPGPH